MSAVTSGQIQMYLRIRHLDETILVALHGGGVTKHSGHRGTGNEENHDSLTTTQILIIRPCFLRYQRQNPRQIMYTYLSSIYHYRITGGKINGAVVWVWPNIFFKLSSECIFCFALHWDRVFTSQLIFWFPGTFPHCHTAQHSFQQNSFGQTGTHWYLWWRRPDICLWGGGGNSPLGSCHSPGIRGRGGIGSCQGSSPAEVVICF